MELSQNSDDDRHIVTLTVQELQDAISNQVKIELEKLFKEHFDFGQPSAHDDDMKQSLIGRQDLAKMFGVSTVSLDKWKRAGLLPKPIKMAGRVYYLKNEIMEMLNNRKTK